MSLSLEMSDSERALRAAWESYKQILYSTMDKSEVPEAGKAGVEQSMKSFEMALEGCITAREKRKKQDSDLAHYIYGSDGETGKQSINL